MTRFKPTDDPEKAFEECDRLSLELANALDDTFLHVMDAWRAKHRLSHDEAAGIATRAMLIEAGRAWKAVLQVYGTEADAGEITSGLLDALPTPDDDNGKPRIVIISF